MMNQDSHDLLSEALCTVQQVNLGEYPESNCERVRNWARKCHGHDRQLFCEMLELVKLDNDDYCWYEQARWIKYEETVEGSKQRWSKPHIPLLTLQSIFQLKNCLKRGVILLDLEVRTFPQLVDKIIKEWENEHMLHMKDSDLLRVLLLCNKEHLSSRRGIREKFANLMMKKTSVDTRRSSAEVESNSIAASGDEGDFENESPEADAKTSGLNIELSKKLSENAEVAVLLIGKSEDISNSLCAFVRLKEANSFSNCSEVNRRLKFLFVLIVPEDHDNVHDLEMVGRAFAAILTDDIFIHIAYEAEDVIDVCHGIDEFLSSMKIIPPGKWRSGVRLEPSDTTAVAEVRPRRSHFLHRRGTIRKKSHDFHFDGLQYTGRVFGGLVDDVKRKVPFYVSDFLDGVSSLNAISQCTAAALYLFFANLTNIITFGGVMGGMLHNEIAVMECIISGFINGIVFALFSGQPLNILSATGPVLIFETLFYKFCLDYGWKFLSARFWLGFWSTIQIFVLVALDASFLVAYITRFTEECFATLISVIFIVESIQAMLHLAANAPLTIDPTMVNDTCRCVFGNNSDPYVNIWGNMTQEVCTSMNGTNVGHMCNFHPDVFMFSLLLFFGTFALASILRSFRTSRFFPTKVRSVIGDFAVFLAICLMTMISYFVGLHVETLDVPTDFKPTKSRSWIIDVTDMGEWWVSLACFVPALLLTVLIVMDQQITAVIVNRKDNKLKKGFGYHLDLLLVGFLIIICSLFGLPFFVAATILSITHVQSLRMESECAAPGETPVFLGVREQRVTTLIAHILIGLSIFLAPIQRLVPTAVLLGVFLYMGVSCLSEQQFVQRILLFLTPIKYQPDFGFLRVVPLKRVFLFTAIQLLAFVLLCAVKYSKQISMLFPILLIVLVGVRKGIDRFFTQEELSAMDDILPFRSSLRKRTFNESKRNSRLVSLSSTNEAPLIKLSKKITLT